MKKAILSLGVLFLSAGAAFAQDSHAGHDHASPVAQEQPSTSLNAENMVFVEDVHDFGTVPEGPAAVFEFKFKNTGKEPIVLKQVSPSCGCTTPTYSKEPVLPGKTGVIKASYATQGRPNPFTKTITVVSNAGTKILTIKGNVEKAPENSVPQNTSMIKN